MTAVIIIPARFASTRLPRKMLLDTTGKPLVQHTYEQACRAASAARVIIATDHDDIFAAARRFTDNVIMTDPAHQSGTDRLSEVARTLDADVDLIVNVQGDEPEIDPGHIDALVALHRAAKADIATLVTPFPAAALEGAGSPLDPNCVKAVLGKPVTDANGSVLGHDALYFSRSLVPYPRDAKGAVSDGSAYFLHLGIYAYTPAFLRVFPTLPPGVLEMTEKLEQLRALENGYRIVAGRVPHATPGIDTAEDYAAFTARNRG